jgi:glutamate-5-semialdehyde dehydrogenase
MTLQQARLARNAAAGLAGASGSVRDKVLAFFMQGLQDERAKIIAANQMDLDAARQDAIAESLIRRLKLDGKKFDDLIEGLSVVMSLADPLGKTLMHRAIDDDLILQKITAPIGVVAVIFESRPDALPQIAALAIKSGNAVILKGGREALHTNTALFDCLRRAVAQAGLPEDCVQLLMDRKDVDALLSADDCIDLIVPRGSSDLVRYIQKNTEIQVLGHAEGICHAYVDASADLDLARKVLIDAKCNYPAACNAIETVLFDDALPDHHVIELVDALKANGVSIRALRDLAGLIGAQVLESPSDFATEYGDLTIALAKVSGVDGAIEHVRQYGSGHTEIVLAQDLAVFDKFFAAVNAAGIYLNASSRFADGFRYGFGAEVGISTGKFHPRGPVGIEGLVSYKYKIVGKGNTVGEYADGTKTYKHRDL